jgi:hypothetical protein
MKNNKKYTISEAAAEAMGLGAISDGKPDYDVSGRGSMTPPPIVAGVPATMPVGAPVVPNTMAAKSMAAPIESQASQEQGEEETEETEETEDSEEPTEVEEQARAQFRNALISLLGEDVDQKTVSQIEGIFEAAVNDRVERTVASIVESVDGNVKTYLDTITESLVEKVDDYLDYVVEEWMTENAVAVEQGIKTQIAENFINGLKNLFENHYIDVPNEKYNVLDELYAQNRELENKLNEAVNYNINLRKEVELTECAGIFVAETRDLADTQVSKLQSLMESVSFTNPEEYRAKLVAIKENYINTTRVSAPSRAPEPEQTFSPVKGNPTTLVEGYVGALGRLNKKV